MPTYEYACSSCGYEWEQEQSIKADPLKDCPSCKAATAKRQISKGTGFILKGGGWYSDLYSGSSNQKGGARPEPGTTTKTETATTTTTVTTTNETITTTVEPKNLPTPSSSS
jgi:putative FmdB family regulatory protein